MQLHHEVTVAAPVEEVWPALLDIEGVAPCLPGARVEHVEGDTVDGGVTVKVGPITVAYQGKAEIRERDEAAHRLVLHAAGRETRGPGTAQADLTAQLAEHDGGTLLTVDTDLAVTGRPAQFGRGVMGDVGERVIGQFADALSQRLAAPASGALEQQPAEPLDLLRAGSAAALKRALPVALALVALVAVAIRLRRALR